MIRCNLSALLAERDMTAAELSVLSNVGQNTLSQLANNVSKGIKFEVADRICKGLDCTLSDLFSYANLSVRCLLDLWDNPNFTFIVVLQYEQKTTLHYGYTEARFNTVYISMSLKDELKSLPIERPFFASVEGAVLNSLEFVFAKKFANFYGNGLGYVRSNIDYEKNERIYEEIRTLSKTSFELLDNETWGKLSKIEGYKQLYSPERMD